MDKRTDNNHKSTTSKNDKSEDISNFGAKKRLLTSEENLDMSSSSESVKRKSFGLRNESFDETDIFNMSNESPRRSAEGRKDLYQTIEKLGLKNQQNVQEGLALISSLSESDPIQIKDVCPSVIHSLPSSCGKNDSSTNDLADLDPLSTSFYETESVASMSQSACSEDFNLKTQIEAKNSKKKKKKKRHSGTEKTCADGKEKKFVRPNYFVGIQVSNPEIHQAVVETQNSLVSFNEKLSAALVDVATLHITLLVAHIAEEKDLKIACSALDQCGTTLSQSLSNPPLCLKFHGISHFSNQTIYAKVVEDEQYDRLVSAARVVRSVFAELGVEMPDQRDLTPHLTFAKLSKVPRGKGKPGIRKIDPASYEDHLDKPFGEQVVTGLQLLSMNMAKDAKRYYHSIREFPFGLLHQEESLDHSYCCNPRHPSTPKLSRASQRLPPLQTPPAASPPPPIKSLPRDPSPPPPNPSPSPPPPFHERSLARTVVGGAALLSLAFALSKWLKRN